MAEQLAFSDFPRQLSLFLLVAPSAALALRSIYGPVRGRGCQLQHWVLSPGYAQRQALGASLEPE